MFVMYEALGSILSIRSQGVGVKQAYRQERERRKETGRQDAKSSSNRPLIFLKDLVSISIMGIYVYGYVLV